MSDSGIGRTLLRNVATGAAGALGAYGAARGILAARRYLVSRGQDAQLAAMEKEFPDLRDVPDERKRRAYRAMLDYAPTFAQDPYVGGEMLYAMSQGRPAITILREGRQLEQMTGQTPADVLAHSIGGAVTRTAGEMNSTMNKKAELQYAYDLTDEQLANVLQRVEDSLATEKIAFDWDTAKSVGVPIVGALGAAAVSYGVPAAVEAIRAARIRANRDKYISEMKKVHPDMRSMSEQDLHIAYNSIAQHTPDVLQDPLLGGQTLKQMAQFRMANVSALNEISRLRGQRPLDVAFQTATNFLGQGAVDAAKSYGHHQDALARNAFDMERLQLERTKLRDSNLFNARRVDLERDRLTQQNAQFKDREAMEQARYEADRAYTRHRDSVGDAAEQARQATAFQQAVDRVQPVDPTLYQGARGIAQGNQPVLRSDLAQARLRVALDPNKNPAPAPYRR